MAVHFNMQEMRAVHSNQKHSEGFVHWKQKQNSQERGRRSNAKTSKSGTSQSKRSPDNAESVGRGRFPSTSLSRRDHPVQEGVCNYNDFEGRRRQKSTLVVQNRERQGDTSDVSNRCE